MSQSPPGKYSIFAPIGSGGAGRVYLARLSGPFGFSRIVAVKRLQPSLEEQEEFVTSLIEEARLASHIRDPHVVPALDLVQENGELFVVLEYVHGESLSGLLRAARARQQSLSESVAVAIAAGVLRGLHAAHEAHDAQGNPLSLVHRDVSPQNIVVGVDGLARLLDFGVAKASNRLLTTRNGEVKGKPGYMAPEQLRGLRVDRRADIWAAGVVLWEMLAGDRLFFGENDAQTLQQTLDRRIPPPRAGLPSALQSVLLRALDRDPAGRFDTAGEMAELLESLSPASARQIAATVRSLARKVLEHRETLLRETQKTAPLFELSSQPSLPVTLLARPVRPSDDRPTRRWWPVLALVVGLAAALLGTRWVLARRAAGRMLRPAAPALASPEVPTPPTPPPPAPNPAERVVGHREVTSPRPARRRAAPSCVPPYVLTRDGHKHFKPECL